MESLRREVRRLFDKCQTDKNTHSWRLYREAQRNYRQEVRTASRNAWRTLCSSNNDISRLARLHRALSRDPKIKLGSLVAPSVRRTQTEEETLELLLTTHFRNSEVTQDLAASAAALLARRTDYECGHLQKGGMGYRFFCPIQKSRGEWHIPSLVERGTGGCHTTPGQNISCLLGDWLCSSHMETG